MEPRFPERRSPRRRRRHQRRRHRARRGRAGPARAARRAGRPRLAHQLLQQQADPRRAALPRAVRVPAGGGSAGRARGLLKAAPHLVRPMRFVMPHVPQLRPGWMIRAGLFLYDYLARRATLPGSHAVNLGTSRLRRRPQAGIRPRLRLLRLPGGRFAARGRERAQAAALAGAVVLTRTRCASARRANGGWHARLARRGRSDARGDARRRS